MTPNERQTFKHPSYGMIRVCRGQGGPGVFFGSPMRHNERITLTICEGQFDRDLNRDWYHDGNTVVEIDMTPLQWSEVISRMNTQGVPCTIRYRHTEGFKRLPDPPLIGDRARIQNEFKKTMLKLVEDLKTYRTEITEALNKRKGKPLTVADRELIDRALGNLVGKLSDHIPFIHSSFDESVDRTTLAAKQEIEAFVSTIAAQHGLSAERLPRLVAEPDPSIIDVEVEQPTE